MTVQISQRGKEYLKTAQSLLRTAETMTDQVIAAQGAQLAQKLFCASCHLPSYAGREQMPRLARQRVDYLIESLTAYREGRRSGIDTSMNAVMYGTSDHDIRSLAHYLASLR